MSRALQNVSGFLFFTLGISFFVAFVLVRNDLYSLWSAWWMQVADLPFALTAIVYGGTSLYLSIHGERRVRVLQVLIVFPLAALMFFIIALNFWDFLLL